MVLFLHILFAKIPNELRSTWTNFLRLVDYDRINTFSYFHLVFSRFASWVEGDSHVTEDEVSAFERSLDFDPDAGGDRMTDDEDEIDFRLSSA